MRIADPRRAQRGGADDEAGPGACSRSTFGMATPREVHVSRAAFPKAKTNKAMNPASGPATPAEGRIRLETAHQKFAEACRQTASYGERMRTTIFGAVPVEDYVRFMELHTRHHGKQMADS